jgi:thiamine-phosphate pyrophosphorylase
MILHLVTDRRRLAPRATVEGQVECLLRQARYATEAGIDVIQVRERDLDGRPLVRIIQEIVALTRGSRTRVVVNDRLDVALAARADGVHLRGDSFAAARVRECVPPGFLVGRSVRSEADAAGAGPVDYVIAGTVWPTASKPADSPLLGVEGLARIAAVSAAPVIGIGGIELRRMSDLVRAGAAGFAAIGAWIGQHDPCRAESLGDLAQAYREAFVALT